MKHDPLTGLLTQEAIAELQRRFETRNNDVVWSVAKIDLDHLKMINDVYGYVTGDAVLQLIGGILNDHANQNDLIMRVEDDEFLAFFPETTKDNAISYGQSIFEDLAIASFPHSVNVSVSMGFADSEDGSSTIWDLIELADEALTRAKHAGRGRLAVYSRSEERGNLKPKFDHFINRQHELGLLRRSLDASLSGEAEMIIISGEAGVGKSRLLEELKHYAHSKGYMLAGVKYDQQGVYDSYNGLIRAIEGYIDTLSENEKSEFAKNLEKLSPQVYDLLPWMKSHEGREISTKTMEPNRTQFFSWIAEVLKILSSIKPLLLFFEDIQWIPNGNIELLGYIARSLSGHRIMMIATTRILDKQSKTARYLGVLSTSVNTTSIDLNGFSQEFTVHMTTLALCDPDVPDDFLRSLHSRTNGNPLYIRELLAKLYEDGSLKDVIRQSEEYSSLDKMDVPDDLLTVIASRLISMDELTFFLLQIGAMVQSSFSFDLLSTVARRDSLVVASSLDEAMTNGLIREEPGAPGSATYSISHDLIKEHILSVITQAMRDVLHERLAEYFRDRADSGDDSAIPRAAFHFSKTSMTESTQHFALLAARRARAVANQREEADWLEIYVYSTQGDIRNDENAFEALTKLGRIITLMGDAVKGFEYLKKAEGLETSDEERGMLYYLIGSSYFARGITEAAVLNYKNSLEYPLSPLTRCNALAKLGFARLRAGKPDETMEYVSKLYHLEEESQESNEMIRSQALTLHGLVLTQQRDLESACEKFERAAELQEEKADKSVSCCILWSNIACNYFERGYLDKGLEYMNRAEQRLRKMGDNSSLANIYANYSAVYRQIGDLEASEEYSEKCIELSKAAGMMNAIPHAYSTLALLAYTRGDFSIAMEHLEKMRRLCKSSKYTQLEKTSIILMAMVHFDSGDIESTRSIISDIEVMKEDIMDSDSRVLMLKALILDPEMDSKGERLNLLREAWSAAQGNSSIDSVPVCSALVGELDRLNLQPEAEKVRREFGENIRSESLKISDPDIRQKFLSQDAFAQFVDSE